MKKGTIQKHIARYEREMTDGILPPGRPSVLTSEQIQPIIERISAEYYAKQIVTYPMIAQWIEEEYQVQVPADTIGAILRRTKATQSVLAPIMDEKRYECDPDSIDDYFEELERLCTRKPACLVANLDEMGYLESQDTRKQWCIIPSDAETQSVRVPVDRQKRRISILQCIFADGTKLRPAVVVPRKTGERELLDLGILPTHCLVYWQENGFMTSDIFIDWTFKELIPAFQERIEEVHQRNEEGELELTDDECRGLLICDGLKQHFTDYVEDIAFENCIDLLELPSHSSDQTQPCDLCIFAVCKTIMPSAGAEGENLTLFRLLLFRFV